MRENPASLVADPAKELRAFRVATSASLGTKRGRGRGSFIDSVLSTVDSFYAEVLESVRPWSATPPKLRPSHPSPPDIDEAVSTTLTSSDYSSQDDAGDFDDPDRIPEPSTRETPDNLRLESAPAEVTAPASDNP